MNAYTSCGKQVLRGRDHIADAVDPTYAQIIADALNDRPRVIEIPIMEHKCVELPVMPERERHTVYRQNDEYACSCGARWPYHDGIEHP